MPANLILKELSRYKIGTYADIIYRNALLRADHEVFVYGAQRITFSQFNKRVNSLIAALYSLGLKKGDGIGILSWNCLEYTDIYRRSHERRFCRIPFQSAHADR